MTGATGVAAEPRLAPYLPVVDLLIVALPIRPVLTAAAAFAACECSIREPGSSEVREVRLERALEGVEGLLLKSAKIAITPETIRTVFNKSVITDRIRSARSCLSCCCPLS